MLVDPTLSGERADEVIQLELLSSRPPQIAYEAPRSSHAISSPHITDRCIMPVHASCLLLNRTTPAIDTAFHVTDLSQSTPPVISAAFSCWIAAASASRRTLRSTKRKSSPSALEREEGKDAVGDHRRGLSKQRVHRLYCELADGDGEQGRVGTQPNPARTTQRINRGYWYAAAVCC